MAGVDFFSPQSFADQKPIGQQRECLMMVPAPPGARFVIGQSRFTFGALQTFLDATPRFGRPREFSGRRLRIRIRQPVIVDPVRAFLASCDDQHLGRVGICAFGHREHRRRNDLDHHRPFLAIADFDARPGLRLQRATPCIDTDKGRQWLLTETAVRRRLGRQIADERVGRNRQQVAFLIGAQIAAKLRGPAKFIVPHHPSMRQRCPMFLHHLPPQFQLGREFQLRRNVTFFPPRFILDPLLRKVQTHIDQRMFPARHVTQIHAHLAVVNFSQPAVPLSLHAHRFGSLR